MGLQPAQGDFGRGLAATGCEAGSGSPAASGVTSGVRSRQGAEQAGCHVERALREPGGECKN